MSLGPKIDTFFRNMVVNYVPKYANESVTFGILLELKFMSNVN